MKGQGGYPGTTPVQPVVDAGPHSPAPSQTQRAQRKARKAQNALLWEVWSRTRWHPNHHMDAHEYDWHEDWPPDLETMRSLFVAIVEATQAALGDGGEAVQRGTNDHHAEPEGRSEGTDT